MYGTEIEEFQLRRTRSCGEVGVDTGGLACARDVFVRVMLLLIILVLEKNNHSPNEHHSLVNEH
jgi:hypothetical protein